MVKVNYIADFTDIADYFDAAYLLLSDKHDVTIVAPASEHNDIAELIVHCGATTSCLHANVCGLLDVSANWAVTSDYNAMLPVLQSAQGVRRNIIERLFIIGGHANDYSGNDQPMRFDPRLREREPARFAPEGDIRGADTDAFNSLLLSREAVIWLPRDICLWRYAAPQIFDLAPNPVNQWLAKRLALVRGEGEPVLMSTFPAFCLAITPDTMPWLRLFHTVLGRIELSPLSGRVTPIITQQGANAYIVTAIDGFACGKFITNVLRGPAQ